MTNNIPNIRVLENMVGVATDLLKLALPEAEEGGQNRTAVGYAQQVQKIYLDFMAKAAERTDGGIEVLVNNASRQLPVARQIEANALYHIGRASYVQQQTLDEAAEGMLVKACNKYQDAKDAFRQFDTSFNTPEEQGIKQRWLGQLYPRWADSCLILGADAHKKGNIALTKPPTEIVTKDDVLKGLDFWDKALQYYAEVFHISEAARTIGTDLQSYVNQIRPRTDEIKQAASSWARAISEPVRAVRYLT